MPRLTIGVFLVDQASHRFAVGSDRKTHLPLRADDGWILPTGSSGICEFDEAHSFLTLELPDALMDEVGFDKSRGFAPVFGALDPLLVQFVHHAVLEAESAPSLYRDTMDLALASHLTRLLLPVRPFAEVIEDKRLRRAVAYIQANISQDLSLDAMASEAAMSRFHFARAFRLALGKSPLQYVIGERMERAKILLKGTRAPVADIALNVGYQDVSRFGQHFKRHSGATPAAFRHG